MHDMEIISALRLALADRVGQDRFDLWFSRSSRLTIDEKTLTVEAGDQFSLDWIRNHFRNDLELVLTELCTQRVIGEPPSITFRINNSLKQAAADNRSPQREPVANGDRQRPAQPVSWQRKFSRLEDFTVCRASRIAYTSCQIVAEQPGSVSPLFLYGPHGIGKTHLLEGVWSALRRSGRLRRLVYLSAEQFTSYFLEALHGSGLPNFRRKYRDTDLLIVDDVQFFVGKKATLVELLHTMDAILREGRQLVLAADRAPAELSALGADVIGRMCGGLVCRMDQPDQQARQEIARLMANRCNIDVPDMVLEYVAVHFTGDARQICGAINRLKATSQAVHKPVSMPLAKEALEEIVHSTCRVVRLEEIEAAVCDVFGLKPQTLQSDRKTKSVSHPRMLAMWLARKYTRAALCEIGNYFGGRSHSTVVSAQKKVQRWLSDGQPVQLADRDWRMEDALQRIETRLRTG